MTHSFARPVANLHREAGVFAIFETRRTTGQFCALGQEEKRQNEQITPKTNDAASLPCRVLFISGEEAAVPSSRMLALARALTRQGMRVILATPAETESWPLGETARGHRDGRDLQVPTPACAGEGADEDSGGRKQEGSQTRKEEGGAMPGVFVPTHSQTPWARAETLRTLKALIKREDIQILHSFGAYAADIAAALRHCGNKRKDADGRWFRPALPHIAQGDDALLAELAAGKETLAAEKEPFAAHKDAIFSQSRRPDAFFATGSRERNELIDRWHQPAQSVFLSLEGIDTLQYAPKQDVLKEAVQDNGKEASQEQEEKALQEPVQETDEKANKENGKEKEYLLSTANCLTVDMIQKDNSPSPALPVLRRQDKAGARILCAACLTEEEAYTPFLLLDLIGFLKESAGASLTLLGDGPLFEKMAAKVKAVNEQYGCAVVLLPEGDLATLAARHDIFVGSGRAALSALAAGLPVILSDNRGMIDFFSPSARKEPTKQENNCAGVPSSCDKSNDQTVGAACGAFTPQFFALSRQGFRPVGFPLATRQSMKEALCALFDADPAALIAFGREGRAFVEAYHSLAKEAADCASLYRRLLSARVCKYPKTLIVAPNCRRPGELSALEGLVRALSAPSVPASACAPAFKESPVHADGLAKETALAADARENPAAPSAACETAERGNVENTPVLCQTRAEEAFCQNSEMAIWGDPSLAPFFPGIRIIPRGFSFSLLPLFLSLRRVVAAPGAAGRSCDGKRALFVPKVLHLAAKMKKPVAYWGLSLEALARSTEPNPLLSLAHRLPGRQKTLVFSSLTPPKEEGTLAETSKRADKEKTWLRFAPPPALILPPWEEARGLRREEEKRPFCLFLLDMSPWAPVTVPEEGAKSMEKARKKSFYSGLSPKEELNIPFFGEKGLVPVGFPQPYTAPAFVPDWLENSPNEAKTDITRGNLRQGERLSAGNSTGKFSHDSARGKSQLPVIHTVYPLRAFFEKNRKGREEGIAFFAKLALFAAELGFRPLFLLQDREGSNETLKELVLAIVTRCEKESESAPAPVIRFAAPGEQAALAKKAAFTVTTYEDGLWPAAAAGTPLLYLSAAPKARATVAALPSAALLSPSCHTQSAAIGAKGKKKIQKRPARPIPPQKTEWDSVQGLSDAKEAIFSLLSLGQENKEAGLKKMQLQKEAVASAAKAVQADLAFFDRQRALAKRRRARKKKDKGAVRGMIPETVPGTVPGKAAKENTP